MTANVSFTSLDPTALDDAARALPSDRPVVMLNLLRFRPDPGRETYLTRYLPAFNASAAPFGEVRLIWLGVVAARLVGPEYDRWDDMALVEYPSFATFRAIVTSPAYLERAAPHRAAALADWRLLAGIPGQL